MVTPFARRTLLSLAFVALVLVGSSAAVHAYPTQPPAGTLTEMTTRLEFTGGGLVAPNVSGLCVTGTEDCDIYLLDVNLPADYAATHPNAKVRITVGWQNPGADYDVYLVTRPDFEPIDDAAGTDNPEVIEVPAPSGNNQWEIDIVGFLPFQRRGSAAARRRPTPTATACPTCSTSARARPPARWSTPWAARFPAIASASSRASSSPPTTTPATWATPRTTAASASTTSSG